jgi:hypothetical protein
VLSRRGKRRHRRGFDNRVRANGAGTGSPDAESVGTVAGADTASVGVPGSDSPDAESVGTVAGPYSRAYSTKPRAGSPDAESVGTVAGPG